MSKTRNSSVSSFIYTIICTATAMIGYHIHQSIFWAIIDFIFAPIAWIKWLVCAQVNVTIIKDTFSFFFT